MSITEVDLSKYVLVGRYDLPEPTNISPPDSTSLLAQEASSVTYNWDTNTLFVVGDGGTSVVQVSLTGQLIDSMTLAPGGSPQGTTFYDTEGLTYVGNGQFVMTEERDRQVVQFTYAAGTTLTRDEVSTVKLGTTIGNIGLEGVTYDPLSGGYILVKEKTPESIFQTNIDFVNHTATNGSPTTDESTNLFDPAKVGTTDFSDVFALSNLPSLSGQDDYGHLLIISQESGKVVEVDRDGDVLSTLNIVGDPGNPLSVADQTMEGVTMDRDGNLYIVNENGGGDAHHPQLWVYAPSSATNQAPSAVTLTSQVNSLAENSDTTSRIKVANVQITDDGLGTNNLSVSGADTAFFEVDNTGLYIKAGTVLDFETKASYAVTVNVDDPAVGATPDASTNFSLSVNDIAEGGAPHLIVSEVAAWSSGNSPLGADWFEVTNTGTAAVNIGGWKMDDNSNSFGNAVALSGVTSIGAGESVIFIETGDLTAAKAAFIDLWFGGHAPAGLQIGSYSGSGVGLSTSGDAINLYNGSGVLQANVQFGTSPGSAPFATFDNTAGVNNGTISQLSTAGTNGATAAPGDTSEVGSPGTIASLNTAPTALALNNQVTSIAENTLTAAHIKVADVAITDDGHGTNNLSLSGADAAFFEVDSTGLYIKAGMVLDFETKANYAVTVNVDDPTVGVTPDASTNFSLSVSNVINEGVSPTLFISEVAPWSSGDSPVAADWFEVTNTGTAAVDITGWKMDDNSNSFGNAVALTGLTSIGAGESVIFIETTGTKLDVVKTAFINGWFDGHAPAGLQIGGYGGSGVGLSTGGDAVNLFDSHGVLQANVSFGASPAGPFPTFDNDAGLNNAALSGLSVAGDNGAFAAAQDAHETGSPGVYTGVINDKPIFTSPATFDMAENQTAVGSVAAADPEHDAVVFGLAGGDDKSFFAIDPHTGALQFITSPDFETKADANHDNVYELTVSATDVFGAGATQTIRVHVTDVTETGNTFTGGNGDDALTGTTGNDSMAGGNGDDSLKGGDGNDTISGGNGNDVLLGGRGDDVLDGANGNDVIDGGAGNNYLAGGNGDDILRAGDGNNQFDGGNGNDRLTVGTGNNILTGGNGNDAFVFGPGFANNVVTDFRHGDVIEFDGGAFANFAAVQAAMHLQGNDTVIGIDDGHSITLQGVAPSYLHASDFLFA